MPYPGIPSHLTGKVERCVADLKRKGTKGNVYAICIASIRGKRKKDEARHTRTALRRIAEKKK